MVLFKYFKREDSNAPRYTYADDIIPCEVPPPNLNFSYSLFRAKPPNLKTTNISGYLVIHTGM